MYGVYIFRHTNDDDDDGSKVPSTTFKSKNNKKQKERKKEIKQHNIILHRMRQCKILKYERTKKIGWSKIFFDLKFMLKS